MSTPDPACPDYPNECVHPWAHARTHAEVKATQPAAAAAPYDAGDAPTATTRPLPVHDDLPRVTAERDQAHQRLASSARTIERLDREATTWKQRLVTETDELRGHLTRVRNERDDLTAERDRLRDTNDSLALTLAEILGTITDHGTPGVRSVWILHSNLDRWKRVLHEAEQTRAALGSPAPRAQGPGPGRFCPTHWSWLCQAGQGQCQAEAISSAWSERPAGAPARAQDEPDPRHTARIDRTGWVWFPDGDNRWRGAGPCHLNVNTDTLERVHGPTVEAVLVPADRLHQDADLAPWIRRAISDPGSIAGPRRGPHWPDGHEGWAEHIETVTAWSTRAVLRVLAVGGRPHCERCGQQIAVDDSYDPPLTGIGLWQHKGDCPAPVEG